MRPKSEKDIKGDRKPDFAILIEKRGRVVARVRLDEHGFRRWARALSAVACWLVYRLRIAGGFLVANLMAGLWPEAALAALVLPGLWFAWRLWRLEARAANT